MKKVAKGHRWLCCRGHMISFYYFFFLKFFFFMQQAPVASAAAAAAAAPPWRFWVLDAPLVLPSHIRQLGGLVVQGPEHSTHCIVGQEAEQAMSWALAAAAASGAPLLRPAYIESSLRAGRFLPEHNADWLISHLPMYRLAGVNNSQEGRSCLGLTQFPHLPLFSIFISFSPGHGPHNYINQPQ